MLTVNTPTKYETIGISEVSSNWSAAFNPVVFDFQRMDGEVLNVQAGVVASETAVRIQGTAFNDADVTGKYVYLNSNQYDGVYRVISVATGTVTILLLDTPFIGNSVGGYANNLARTNYRIEFYLYIFNGGFYPTREVIIKQTTGRSGGCALDVAPAVRDTMRAICEQTSTAINTADNNLYGFYQLGWSERYEGGVAFPTDSEPDVAIQTRFYFNYAANQYKNIAGSNMIEYVPMIGASGSGVTAPDLAKMGKFLTKFEEPKYWNGYPFKLMFIYSENLNGQALQRNEFLKDLNGGSISDTQTDILTSGEEAVNYLNISGSYASTVNKVNVFITIDETAIVTPPITGQPPIQMPVTPVSGFNGLITVSGTLAAKPSTKPYVANLYFSGNYVTPFTGESNDLQVVETVPVCVIHDCVENPFYLKWLNTLGGFDYFMFGYSQTDSVQTRTKQQFEPSEWDIAEAERGAFELRNLSQQKYKLGALAVSDSDLRAMKDLFSSPIVYRVEQDGTQHRVTVTKGSFKIIETRNNVNDISFEVKYPESIIQLG